MLVSYLTETNYTGLSAQYPYDDNINFQNIKLGIDGRLSINISPVFCELNDFKKNNYSLMYLTKQSSFLNLTDFYAIKDDTLTNTLVGKIFSSDTFSSSGAYLKFVASIDDQEFLAVNYDQSFVILNYDDPLNIFHFIKKDSIFCNVMYYYKNNEYYLNFNPVTLNLNFTVLSAFSDVKDYTRNFYYTYDDKSNVFTLQCRINGIAYRVIRNYNTSRLALSTMTDIDRSDKRCLFYLYTANKFSTPEITVDWGSYQKKFNQNNLLIDATRSFYDTKSNFLIHSEYFNFNRTYLPYDILSLKTQLNSKNYATRGNIFPDEDQVTNRDYVTIFSGGRQEKGYEKLHLQYQTYTHPYEFIAGKTTWFHTPQSMHPYERMNINNTSLIDAGAVGGDHPLRSDKVFKKLGNYKNTANFGNSTSEQTGQWLCSWLSAAPDINVKPVWVDRFFNPSKLTPFQALSASPGSIIYNPSYNCYLSEGIYDAPSSLTFEPGNLYAYSRLGRIDAQQNILALNESLQIKNFSDYRRLDGKDLQEEVRDNMSTFTFDSDSYSVVNVESFKSELNVFSVGFWAYRENWSEPCGFQLGGNYTDYGLGIFNYEYVNPLLMYISTVNGQSVVNAYNSNLELVNVYNANGLIVDKIDYFARRDVLNSFHLFSSLSSVYELNLQEAIIDSAKLPSRIRRATNDDKYCYMLLDGTPNIYKLNLLTNEIFLTAANFNLNLNQIIDPPLKDFYISNATIAVTNDSKVILLSTYGVTEPRVISNYLYFLDDVDTRGGTLKVWDTTTNTKVISSVIPAKRFYTYFNIDKNCNLWCVSGTKIDIYKQYGLLDRSISLTNSLSSYGNFSILNVTFTDNFVDGELVNDTFITTTGVANNTYYISKLDDQGNVVKTVSFYTSNFKNIDPSNHSFFYSRNVVEQNKYTFKARLYNQFDTEDSIILNLPVLNADLNPGYHHFAITVDCLNGKANLYVDNEVYVSQDFTPGKFLFASLLEDNLVVGATPFYNGALLDTFLSKKIDNNFYTVKDLKIQNFYWFNKILNYFDISMLYKEKYEPDNLLWDVPCGRRNFNETISRYFRNKVPGAKSTLINVYVNSGVLDEKSKNILEPELIQRISKNIPSYTKLNKFIWTTNLPGLTAASQQPYYPGNTITNAGFSR